MKKEKRRKRKLKKKEQQAAKLAFFREYAASASSEDDVARALLAELIDGFISDSVASGLDGPGIRSVAAAKDPIAAIRELPPLSYTDVWDPRVLYTERQLRGFVKRYLLSAREAESQRDTAYSHFVENQERLSWHSTHILNHAFDRHQVILDTAAYELWRAGLDDLHPRELARNLRPGPGSTIDGGGQDVSLFHKFAEGPITGTRAAFGLARSVLTYDRGLLEELRSVPAAIVEACEGLFVTKDDSEMRTIAREGILNGALQQAVARHCEACLRTYFHIDLSTAQDLHKQLARDASLGIVPLATFDLSKASDSILVPLVRRLLRYCPTLLGYMEDLRSDTITFGDDRSVKLQAFSTMGVAFTFPLQTLVFVALLRAICHDGEVRVFGDDMIFPSKYAEQVTVVLSDLGFLVNNHKSFSSGCFRESCGGDYYRGVDVRPFHPERPDHLDKNESIMQYLLVWGNCMTLRMLNHGIEPVRLCRRLGVILTTAYRLSGVRVGVIPAFLPDDYGIKANCWEAIDDVMDRWSSVAIDRPCPVFRNIEPGDDYSRVRIVMNLPRVRRITNDGIYYYFNSTRRNLTGSDRIAVNRNYVIRGFKDPVIPMSSVFYKPPKKKKDGKVAPEEWLVPLRTSRRSSRTLHIRNWMWGIHRPDDDALLAFIYQALGESLGVDVPQG